MPAKWFAVMVTIAILAAATACSPSPTGEEVVSMQNNNEITVEMVPVPENPDEAGSSAPSMAGEGESSVPEQPGDQQASGMSLVYTDDTYKFAVEYPSDFKFLAPPAEKLDGLIPLPLAAFRFTNPLAASSDIAELEPADLEIRVYDAMNVVSLEHWLDTTNLGGEGATSTAFETSHVSGLKVCAAAMIFPACSYLVIGDQRVYQLIPVNLAGEEMVKSFMLIP